LAGKGSDTVPPFQRVALLNRRGEFLHRFQPSRGLEFRRGGQGTPVSPKDILATTSHLVGIDPATLLSHHLGRPLPVAGDGKVRGELLG
jgi:hypothetical protein